MSRHRRAQDKVHDVLEGRTRPSVLELFELIHAINPTSRASEPKRSPEVERAYELKARLQSLLVRKFGDELRVTAERDGTIGIAHRYSSRDGCHAQLDALDEEARAWVRWQLDTAEGSQAAGLPAITALPSSPLDDPTDALERGRQALAAYDFEAAVSLFREALEESGGAAPARALLEVLVDSLAQDDEALALEPEIGPAAREDPEVRSLLGLAAARAGDGDRARRWLAGTTGPRAAEAWAALARRALDRVAWQDAEHATRELEHLDGGHPALPELREAIAVCRANARRPEEEALQAALNTGDDATAEARARAILARWPDSAAAGRALAVIDERRRAHAAESSRRAASDALTRGDFATARELALRARAFGADARELLTRIDAAEAETRAAADAARIDAVCGWLAGDEHRGLGAYLDLETELRARVRARVGDASVLEWLDELAPFERGKLREKARAAAIDAVLALREARTEEAVGAHGRAAELIERHAVLGDLRAARVLHTRVREAEAAHRKHEAESALDAAVDAWTVRDAGSAARLLEGLDRRALSPEQRARADQLGAAIQREREREARMQRIVALVASREFVAARRELEVMIVDPEHDQAAAQQQLEAVRGALREKWRVRSTVQSPLDWRSLGELVGAITAHDMPEPWASADGHVVLAAVHERHVFVAAIDLARDRAIIHHVETPAPLGRHAERCVDGDRLWIAGDRDVLQMDWRTGDVVRWESLRPFLDEAALLEQIFVVPAARSLWIETRVDREWTLRVVDLDRWAVVRTVNAGRFQVVVPGDDPLVAALDHDSGAVLYAGRGGHSGQIAELRGQRVMSVVRHPELAGFVVVACRPDEDTEASLFEIVPGRPLRAYVLPHTYDEGSVAVVARRGHGNVVVYTIGSDGPTLSAIRTATHGLDPAFRVPAPRELVLAHDPTSHRAFVIWEQASGVHVSELGDEAPSFGESEELEPFPGVAPHFLCGHSGAGTFDRADEAARTGRWDEVRAQLTSIDVAALPAGQREHHHHLLGLASARLGEPERAREIWEAGRQYEEPGRMLSCQLPSCLDVIEELPPTAAEGESLIKRLRRAIIKSAACASMGDARGVVAALRSGCVHRLRERQSLARLADAWLALPDEAGEAAWFEKAQALSQFLDVADSRERDLPIAGAWDDARVAGVAARSRAWLAGAA